MDPTTTRGNWTIDNRTGVIGHATRDFGIELARCDTRPDLLHKLAHAFTKPWMTDTDGRDLVLLMAEACGVYPDRDNPIRDCRLAEEHLRACRNARRHPSGPPVGFVSVERYLTLD
jgi:hypothetical protein